MKSYLIATATCLTVLAATSVSAATAGITTTNKASTSAGALLKNYVKTGTNNFSAILTDVEEELTDAKTTVNCPSGTRCMIEVQAVLEWEISGAPGPAYQRVKIDGTDVLQGAGAVGGAAGTSVDSVWSRARNVGPGKHVVQVYAGAVGAQKFLGYSVVIRLYKR